MMNQITAESNVVESEINESSTSGTVRAEDAMVELNASQLALIGGGTAAISLL